MKTEDESEISLANTHASSELLRLMLLETHQGSEDTREHTNNREHGDNRLEVVVDELMYGDPHGPFTFELVDLCRDDVVATAKAQVASQALEENEHIMVADEAAKEVLRSQLVYVLFLVHEHRQEGDVGADDEAIGWPSGGHTRLVSCQVDEPASSEVIYE